MVYSFVLDLFIDILNFCHRRHEPVYESRYMYFYNWSIINVICVLKDLTLHGFSFICCFWSCYIFDQYLNTSHSRRCGEVSDQQKQNKTLLSLTMYNSDHIRNMQACLNTSNSVRNNNIIVKMKNKI